MIKNIDKIKKIFFRELRLVSKDINIISVIILAPLFYSFFYGSIYFNKIETDVEIGIFDQDRTASSAKITRYFDSHQTVKVEETITSLEEGNDKLIKGDIKAIVFFPKGFEKKLKSGKRTEIKVYLNSTRFLVSNDINKAINGVIAYVNAGVTVNYFRANGLNSGQSLEAALPIRMDERSLFNFTESYGDFLIPAILILILQQTLLIGFSESIAKERETRSCVELFNLAEYKPHIFILGKGLFYFLLFGSYAFFFFIVNYNVFRIPNNGDFISLALLSLLLIISVIFLSIFIASFFHRKIVSLQFLTLTSYPIFLISGYSWLYQSLPGYLQFISYLIPSTPYFSAVTRVAQMGAGINDIWIEIVHISLLIVAGYLLAHFRVKSIMKEERKEDYSLNTGLETV